MTCCLQSVCVDNTGPTPGEQVLATYNSASGAVTYLTFPGFVDWVNLGGDPLTDIDCDISGIVSGLAHTITDHHGTILGTNPTVTLERSLWIDGSSFVAVSHARSEDTGTALTGGTHHRNVIVAGGGASIDTTSQQVVVSGQGITVVNSANLIATGGGTKTITDTNGGFYGGNGGLVTNADQSLIVGFVSINVDSPRSIQAGETTSVTASENIIIAGVDNTVSASPNSIVGGQQNNLLADSDNSIVAGQGNTIQAVRSIVAGGGAGAGNTNTGPDSIIVGRNAVNDSPSSAILAGNFGTIGAGSTGSVSLSGGVVPPGAPETFAHGTVGFTATTLVGFRGTAPVAAPSVAGVPVGPDAAIIAALQAALISQGLAT